MNLDVPTPLIDNLDYLPDPFRQKVYLPNEFKLPKPNFQETALADYQVSLKFLSSYKGSGATFNSYRREIERLLQWSWKFENKSISALKREHIEAFIEFCIAPPEKWTGSKNVARFKSKEGLRVANPEWRPYVKKNDKYALSQQGIQAIFAILSSYFNFLIQEEFCDQNPVALIRQKSRFIRKQQYQAPVRRITNYQWDTLIRVVEKLASENPEHERTLFILNCLLGMYLRISELVADDRYTPIMGDFQIDQDRNWWFHVVGKGNKSRMITVSDDMLSALKRYRTFLGLSELPYPGEQTPLISKIKGRGGVTSTRQIRYLIQNCFNLAYDVIKDEAGEQEAMELKQATVHWLRHTGISEDVKIRPREHVKEDAGHSSMATTDRYIDSELRERHASGKNKKIKDLGYH